MKHSAVLRIVLFSLIAICLLGVMIAGIALKSFRNHVSVFREESDAEVVLQYTFSPQDIQSLKISWVAGDVVIEPTDTDEITVTEEMFDCDRPMVLKKSDSQLIVEYSEDNNLISINVGSSMKKNLRISVPQDWECEALELDAASTDVKLSGLTIHEVDVDTASGKNTFQSCTVHSLEMDSASGDLEFSGSLEKLKFSGASAEANLVLSNHPQSIRMDSLSGDLNLTLPQDCGFTLDQDSLSGSKTVEFDTQEKDGCLIHGDGSCEIKISGLSASVHVYKAQ